MHTGPQVPTDARQARCAMSPTCDEQKHKRRNATAGMLPERPAGRLMERRWTATLQGATLQGEEGQPQRSDSFKATSSKRQLRGDSLERRQPQKRSDSPEAMPQEAML